MTKNKYIVDYNRTKTKLLTVRLNVEHDKDIINYLDRYIQNKSILVKDLIRAFMKQDGH